jgi:hypothetical protein
MGCKNDLYLAMIEAHIKENPKFHKLSPYKIIYSMKGILKTYYLFKRHFNIYCFQNDLKFYMTLGNV